MIPRTLLAALAAAILSVTANGEGMYSKSSAVLNVDAKSYNKLISKSNQVSIVEFYAPWCGHCQNLKPKYEKAAKSLKDLAQVAAVDCDNEINKPMCASMGVKGFPTLKIVRPSKKLGKPTIEDYQGPRESKDIVESVKQAIPNNVKKITDSGLTSWLETDNSTAKAILFSDKGTTSALTKVLANEYMGNLNFGQIRKKEAVASAMFGVTEYPTLVVVPGGSREPIVYDGAYTKLALKDFLSQHASPSDGSTLKDKIKETVKEKAQKVMGKDNDQEDARPAVEQEDDFTSASSSHKATETSSDDASATSETLENDSNPTESPDPAVTPDAKPIPVPKGPEPIPALESQKDLLTKCFGEKTSTCVLALEPARKTVNEDSEAALMHLAEVAEKHKERQSHLFPFYSVPASNPAAKLIREALELNVEDELEMIAVNGRRGWFRRYESGRYDSLAVETWIDNIRFGEGSKGKIPEELLGAKALVGEEEEVKASTAPAEATAEGSTVAEPATGEPATEEPVAEPATEEPKASAAPTHGEL